MKILMVALLGLLLLAGCTRNNANNEETDKLQDDVYVYNGDERYVYEGRYPEHADKNYPFELTLQYTLNTAMARRQAIVKPDYRDLLYFVNENNRLVASWIERYEDIAEWNARFVQSFTPIARAHVISAEEAIEDAQRLLLLIRLQYGAYMHFGGDEVFIPLFERMIETLSAQDEWNPASGGDFTNVLHYYLSQAIQDNHFAIGGRVLGAPEYSTLSSFSMGVTSTFFVNAHSLSGDFIGAVIERSMNGFRFESGNYIASARGYFMVDGLRSESEGFDIDISTLFRLAVNEYGETAYIPVVAVCGRTEYQELKIVYTFENGNTATTVAFPHEPKQRQQRSASWRRVEGIPVVEIMSMGFYPNGADAQLFLSAADDLRNESVIIVDVRSNSGGNNLLSVQFLHRLTGEVVPTNSVIFQSGSHAQHIAGIEAQTGDEPHFRPPADFALYHPTKPLSVGHFVWNYTPRRIIENETLVVLLVDRYTMSAGEGFADFVLNLENSLIIGQNTAGVMLTTAAPAAAFLPNSGVPVSIGTGVFVHPEGLFLEGIGIEPDIWAVGDALEAALQMIGRDALYMSVGE